MQTDRQQHLQQPTTAIANNNNNIYNYITLLIPWVKQNMVRGISTEFFFMYCDLYLLQESGKVGQNSAHCLKLKGSSRYICGQLYN